MSTIQQYTLLKDWLLEITLREVSADKWADEVKRVFAEPAPDDLSRIIARLAEIKKMMWDEQYAIGYQLGLMKTWDEIAERIRQHGIYSEEEIEDLLGKRPEKVPPDMPD